MVRTCKKSKKKSEQNSVALVELCIHSSVCTVITNGENDLTTANVNGERGLTTINIKEESDLTTVNTSG